MPLRGLFVLALARTVAAASLREGFCGLCQPAAAALVEVFEYGNATALFLRLCEVAPGQKLRDECTALAEEAGASIGDNSGQLLQKYSPRALCSFVQLCEVPCCQMPLTPEQIHLSVIGEEGSEMAVSWVTQHKAKQPAALVGLSPDSAVCTQLHAPVPSAAAGGLAADPPVIAYAEARTYTSGGWTGWIYTARLGKLEHGKKYCYRVGDAGLTEVWEQYGWSEPSALTFRVPPAPGAKTTLAIIGDAGATDASDLSVFRIATRVLSGQVDGTVHGGDISYADGYEQMNDVWSRKTEVMAARAPYLTTPGNHEGYYNFKPYAARYAAALPSPAHAPSERTLYWTTGFGSVQLVALDTEGEYGLLPAELGGSRQLEWLEATLAQADTPESREQRPWIVVFGHRPLRCASSSPDCTFEAELLGQYILPLLKRYHVDVYIGAHVHDYQRFVTADGGGKDGGRGPALYANPSDPVLFVNGAGGCRERTDKIDTSDKELAFGTREVGYMVVSAPNASVLALEFHRAQDDEVLDAAQIVRRRN